MQVNQSIASRYSSDESLKDKTCAGADGSVIMKRDATSGFCVMLQNGLCGILKKQSDEMLGDACFFYPRSIRSFASSPVMAMVLSCPESARIAIASDDSARLEAAEFVRLPESIREYAPAAMQIDDVVSIISSFQSLFLAPENDFSGAAAILASVAQSLDNLPTASWKEAVPFYLRTGKDRLPVAELERNGIFRVLQLLILLRMSYADMIRNDRLEKVITDMLAAMAVEVDWKLGTVKASDSSVAFSNIAGAYQQYGDVIDVIMKRVAASQLVLFGFPFAGYGASVFEKSLLIIIRCMIMRLGLLCYAASGKKIDENSAVDVIQPLSRFLDHQAEAQSKLWLAFSEESGWMKLSKLRGVL